MRSFSVRAFTAFILVGVVAAGAFAAERALRERPGRGKALQQMEQQIRAGRAVTKRIQHDGRASSELKQQAAELDQMLDARERTLAKLDALYRDFLSAHKSDLDALQDLRRQALAVDARLGQAHTALVQANQPDIDELKRSSQRARELLETLRTGYELDRRMHQKK